MKIIHTISIWHGIILVGILEENYLDNQVLLKIFNYVLEYYYLRIEQNFELEFEIVCVTDDLKQINIHQFSEFNSFNDLLDTVDNTNADWAEEINNNTENVTFFIHIRHINYEDHMNNLV